MKTFPIIAFLALLIVLAACGQGGNPEDAPVTIEISEPATSTDESIAIPTTSTTQPKSMEMTPETSPTTEIQSEEIGSEAQDETMSTTQPPTENEPTAPAFEPIEVTFFTPAQGEGPYYTVDKPDDRDNDLTVLEGTAGNPEGKIIEFAGKVYDANGLPIPGIVIEIWQTDNNGVYLHPNDPSTNQRDQNFQFYGEAVTSADGSYDFRTILPGHYEPRPRHIHVKLKFEEQELLTTQFYFADDPELTDESMFTQTESDGAHLIINLEESRDTNGDPILVGQRDIILNVDLSASARPKDN